MKYVLIDTCSLRHLIDHNSYSKYIIDLKNLIDQGEISLLVHNNIIEEWERHKVKWRKDIERKLSFLNKNPSNSENLPVLYNNPRQHLEEQLSSIDKLLENGIKLNTPEGIKNESFERLKQREAPFHNKADSISDWEIIGSAAVYCINYNIPNLFFISFNHNDFGHENGDDKKLHSSLSNRFRDVNIIYMRNVVDFFNEIDAYSFPVQQIQSYKILPNSKFSFESSLANHVLIAFDRLFNDTYKELGYIPLNILRNLYPFTTSKNSKVYSDLFRLSNVNSDLVHFFKNVKVQKNGKIIFREPFEVKGIRDYENKTRDTLRNLRRNIIYYLDEHTSNEQVEIEYYSKLNCNCYKCNYEKFNFYKALENLEKLETTDNKEKLKMAYYHYKVGNLSSAISLYKEILTTAVKNKEFFLYLIANYNLKNIAPLLNNIFRNHSIDEKLSNELKEIDLYEKALHVKGHIDYNFVKFLVDESYFNWAFQNITELSKSIIEHYNMQLRGGWSSNNRVWSLINEYAKLQQFIKENYIICDEYDHFTKLFDSTLEGILASYALEPNQGGRIYGIDNYWINNIIFHSKKDSIKQHIKRYKINKIKLSQHQEGQKHILQIATNLFKHNNQEKISQKIDKNNDFLVRELNTYFDNIMILCSFLELDSATSNKLAIKALNLIKKEDVLAWHNIESILFFIRRKRKSISHDVLLAYFNYFLTSKKWHSVSYLEQLIDCFENNSLIEITDKQFYQLLNMALDKCNHCGNNHGIDALISLFNKTSIEKKQIIKNEITISLSQKFSFDTFYQATIFDVIDFDKKVLQGHLDSFQPPLENHRTFKSAFGGQDDPILPHLNELLNLTFKFEMEIGEVNTKKIKQINGYYSWLLEMEDFNYSEFDPKWITFYNTSFFIRHMRKSKKLHEYLKDYLNKTTNSKISEVYLKICY
ncbi:PIN domain-containing protein [Chryseobacterium sp. TY3]